MLRIIAGACALILPVLGAGLAGAQPLDSGAPLPTEATFGPAPEYVVPVSIPDIDDAVFEPYGGLHYLVVDDQYDARGDEPAMYSRSVIAALNVTGIEQMANFELSFDPGYQRLVINHIRVTRDGVTEDRHEAAQVEFARHESDSTRLIFNGEATALVRIDDIRVGDVLDYAYTIYGENPSYAGEHFRRFGLNWGIPVEQRSLRALFNRGEARIVDANTDDVDIIRERHGGEEEIRLDPVGRSAINGETGAPNWYEQFPTLRISTFADWQAVADWARPLYAFDTAPEVQALADRFRSEHDTPEEQLVAALRFVQNEVRYLALAYGEGSYVPAPPEATLASRYGDCKAKTVLLVALARALGFQADGALVSLGYGHGLDMREPSPGGFDHIIVRVRHDGEDYWLDPTVSHQGGTLDNLVQASYGYALPLGEDDDGLIAMPEPATDGEPTIDIYEMLDISGGRNAPAYMVARTTFTGAEADANRARIADQGRIGLQRAYLDFYNRYFGEVAYLEPLQIEDDLNANRMVINEHVELTNPYEDGDTVNGYTISYLAHGMSNVVVQNAERRRTTPLAVAFPVNVRQIVDLRLTGGGAGWELENQDVQIDNDAFHYRYQSWHQGAGYRMQFRLRALGRSVGPDAAPEVLREHQDMQNASYYAFDMSEPLPDEAAAPETTPVTKTRH